MTVGVPDRPLTSLEYVRAEVFKIASAHPKGAAVEVEIAKTGPVVWVDLVLDAGRFRISPSWWIIELSPEERITMVGAMVESLHRAKDRADAAQA